MKARSRSRKFVLQALYQNHFNPTSSQNLIDQFYLQHQHTQQVDWEFFATLLRGSLSSYADCDALIAPKLERKLEELDPLEKQLLRMAVYELTHHIESPTRSVIDDAVHLAKKFGATDGFKLINAVLDRVAREMPLRTGDLPNQLK